MKTKAQFICAGILLATLLNCSGQPIITSEPQSRTNVVGTNATFTVVATGTEPLVYQWQVNSSDLATRGLSDAIPLGLRNRRELAGNAQGVLYGFFLTTIIMTKKMTTTGMGIMGAAESTIVNQRHVGRSGWRKHVLAKPAKFILPGVHRCSRREVAGRRMIASKSLVPWFKAPFDCETRGVCARFP